MTLLGIGLGRRPRPHRKASADLYALELLHAVSQRAIEQVRLPESESELDPIAGFDLRRRLIAADLFCA